MALQGFWFPRPAPRGTVLFFAPFAEIASSNSNIWRAIKLGDQLFFKKMEGQTSIHKSPIFSLVFSLGSSPFSAQSPTSGFVLVTPYMPSHRPGVEKRVQEPYTIAAVLSSLEKVRDKTYLLYYYYLLLLLRTYSTRSHTHRGSAEKSSNNSEHPVPTGPIQFASGGLYDNWTQRNSMRSRWGESLCSIQTEQSVPTLSLIHPLEIIWDSPCIPPRFPTGWREPPI